MRITLHTVVIPLFHMCLQVGWLCEPITTHSTLEWSLIRVNYHMVQPAMVVW
jgi:hypothetical protein